MALLTLLAATIVVVNTSKIVEVTVTVVRVIDVDVWVCWTRSVEVAAIVGMVIGL